MADVAVPLVLFHQQDCFCLVVQFRTDVPSCVLIGSSTMNATAKQQKETELQTLQQKIQQAYQDGQQELQKKSSELMQPIVAKVRTAIEAVGKAGNYTFIFEDGAAVYTGTNVVDVTKEVQAKIK